jgi:hypothetical protein
MDHLYTVVLLRTDLAAHPVRFCLVRAASPAEIVRSAGPSLPQGTVVAAIADVVLPPSALACIEGGAAGTPYARQATEEDFEGADRPLTVAEFVDLVPRAFGGPAAAPQRPLPAPRPGRMLH